MTPATKQRDTYGALGVHPFPSVREYPIAPADYPRVLAAFISSLLRRLSRVSQIH
jgi:hypothetical protein